MNATQNTDTVKAYCAARATARTAAMLASIYAAEGRDAEADLARRDAANAANRAARLATAL